MIDKIIVSQDRTQIIIYFTDRPNFGLYHSEAKVLDLLAWFLLPIGNTNYDITWDNVMSSQEDTQSIDLRKVA